MKQKIIMLLLLSVMGIATANNSYAADWHHHHHHHHHHHMHDHDRR